MRGTSRKGESLRSRGSSIALSTGPTLPALPLPTLPRKTRPWLVGSPTRTEPTRWSDQVSRRHPPTPHHVRRRCELGSASLRDRVCQYEYISVVAASLTPHLHRSHRPT